MDQSEYDEMLRHLVRIAAHQDEINARQALTNERLALAIDRLTLGQERLEALLQAMKDMFGRDNGHS